MPKGDVHVSIVIRGTLWTVNDVTEENTHWKEPVLSGAN